MSVRTKCIETLSCLFMPRVNKQFKSMLMAQHLKSDKLQAVQLIKLNTLLQHFLSQPYYKDYIGKDFRPLSDIAELQAFAPVSKQFIMEHLKDIQASSKAICIDSTSGSSGRNFKFYHSRESFAARSAAIRLCYKWIDIEYWGDRKMVIWGNSPSASKLTEINNRIKVIVLNNLLLQAYGLDEKRCLKYLQLLSKYKPKVLEGFPGYLLQLVQVGKKNSLIPHSPKVIITSGEMLHDKERAIIMEYFSAPICSRYGSREFGVIAHECTHHSGFHIVPTRFIVETDTNGELLITDLDNYATPFIRYAIGDCGLVKKIMCKCGLSLDTITQIEGRSNDYILTPSGKRLGGQFWTTSSRIIKGIDEFQIIQKKIDTIEIRAKVSEDFKMTNLAVLHNKIKEFSGDDLVINFVIVDEMERTSMGKRRFIINLLNQ